MLIQINAVVAQVVLECFFVKNYFGCWVLGTVPYSEDVLQVNVLRGRNTAKVLECKEAGQLESDVALLANLRLSQNSGKLFFVEILGAYRTMFLHSFELVTSHGRDVLLAVIVDVLLQRVEGLAGGEQITDRLVDDQVGRRNAENLVGNLHDGECMVHKDVASHKLVD